MYMYSVGDNVVKVNDGVCRVAEITRLDMGGVSNDRLYYRLEPVYDKEGRVFVPVEGRTEELRLVTEPVVVREILNKLSDVDTAWIENNKLRELRYKEVLRENDPECMVGYIKVMYQKRWEREMTGKKNTAVDERYLRLLEDAVYAEFAFSLGCQKNDIKELILKKIKADH